MVDNDCYLLDSATGVSFFVLQVDVCVYGVKELRRCGIPATQKTPLLQDSVDKKLS